MKKSLKIIFWGVFSIIVIGLIFFAYQFVKNINFTSVASTPKDIISSKETKTFIDIKRGFSFVYPSTWTLAGASELKDSSFDDLPYIPVFYGPSSQVSANNNIGAGYVVISKKNMSSGNNINTDIEKITADIPNTDVLKALLGSDISVNVLESKKYTLKSGISGFVVTYEAAMKDVPVPKYAIGRYYAYYLQAGILTASSILVSDTKVQSWKQSTFLVDADVALQSFVAY